MCGISRQQRTIAFPPVISYQFCSPECPAQNTFVDGLLTKRRFEGVRLQPRRKAVFFKAALAAEGIYWPLLPI
jgi:hypothetical protein